MSEINERVFEADGINEKIQEHKGSSSSSSSKLSWKRRLFGRKASVHAVLGGGKSADINILWRYKPISGGIATGATVTWLLFEWIGYPLLAFIWSSCLRTCFCS